MFTTECLPNPIAGNPADWLIRPLNTWNASDVMKEEEYGSEFDLQLLIKSQGDENNYVVVACSDAIKQSKEIVVPGIIEGKRIVGAGSEVFKSVFDENDTCERITFSEGIKYLGSYVLNNFSHLRYLQLPDTLLYIGEGALKNNLQEVVLPQSLLRLGSSCFDSNWRINKCNIPSKINKIEMSTFSYCDALFSVKIPSSVLEIGAFAFTDTAIPSLVLPEGIETIGQNAFSLCKNLRSVILPRSLTNIADNAFDSPEKNPLLTFYVYPGSYGLMWAREHGYPVKSAEI